MTVKTFYMPSEYIYISFQICEYLFETPCIMMTSCHYGTVLGRQLEEYEVDVRRSPACENFSPSAEKRSLMEDAIRQRD
jgi:hypothetical protein